MSLGHVTYHSTPLMHFPIGKNPLSPLISEIFSFKDADIHTYYVHTYIQTSTLTDNKECCMLAASISISVNNWPRPHT